MARRGLRIGVAAACVVVALALLRPWTIRPIQSAPPASFDAAAYVTTAWPRVLEEAERRAVELQAARASSATAGAGPASTRAVFVRVTGVVTEVDRRSRVGLVRIRTGAGASALVAVQVGPVVRGSAVRDALPFVRFTDFANQTEFAAVSNALNDRVLRDVVGPVDLESLTGRTIAVIGAASFAGGDRPVELVPVRIRLEGGGR